MCVRRVLTVHVQHVAALFGRHQQRVLRLARVHRVQLGARQRRPHQLVLDHVARVDLDGGVDEQSVDQPAHVRLRSTCGRQMKWDDVNISIRNLPSNLQPFTWNASRVASIV